MPKGFASNARMTILAVCIFALFGVVPARFVWLHAIDRDQRVTKAGEVRRKYDIELSRRGDIIDARGDTLATSRSLVQIAVDPNVHDPAENGKWTQLAALIGITPAELNRICSTKTRAVTAAPAPSDANAAGVIVPAPLGARLDLPDDEGETIIGENGVTEKKIRFAWLSRDGVTEEVNDQINKLGIKKGLIQKRIYERAYPHNQLAAHLIGFVNKEQKPVTGIEAYFDSYLKGIDGWRESEKDARRRELVQFRSREVPAADGYTVRLTIDSVIQKWAEEELASIAAKFTPPHATIIISDAQTGALLALANHPTFNPNEYNKASPDDMANYAIASYVEPGSTFKIVAASGALNDGLVTPDTRFDCSSTSVEYKGRKLNLMVDDHRWDHPLSVSEIISHSSNRGAALLAMRLGDQRFYDYVRAFGFGARTGFPLGGEIYGAINPVNKWSGIDITRIPAGYSVGATPLQIHYAMASIASGGELVTPQLVSEVRKPDGELAFQFGRDVRRRVINPETARIMRDLLQRVVSSEGTAGKIALPGYEFAGKTGTAQKLVNGRYSKKNHVASFCGFFPSSAPRVVITVIVDDANLPDGRAAYGGSVAAPSFRHIAEKLIPYLNIKPSPGSAPALLRPNTAVASRQP